MKLILFLVPLFCIHNICAQNRIEGNNSIDNLSAHRTGSTWYKLNKALEINRENINTYDIKRYFGMDNDGSFKLLQKETDAQGNLHEKFIQQYKNIPLQFCTVTLHQFVDGRAEISGKFIPNFVNNSLPVLSSGQAVERAKEYFPAKVYMWDDSIETEIFRKMIKKTDTSLFPQPQLIWATSTTAELKAEKMHLAYKFYMYGKEPSFFKEVYVDAITGELIHAYEQEFSCGNPTFMSNFYGTLSTKDHYKSSFPTGNIMVDSFCNIGDVIHVSDNANLFSPYNTFPSFVWSSNNNVNSAFSSMWAIRKTEEYYNSIHGRLNGFDESILDVDLRQHTTFLNGTTPYYANASFNPLGICKVGNNEGAFGSSNTWTKDDWNSLDILGHELTHGVTAHECALVYESESGALNESFSDIFGVNVYLYNFPSLINDPNIWKVGYDRVDASNNHLHIRDMANPASFGDPDYYIYSPQWQSLVNCNPNDTTGGGNDACYVHTNSGVQNKMYYLLVKGGVGTSSSGFNYNLNGIGITAARNIAYKALTTPGYLTSNANHSEARDAWVHAAVDLYGYCSTEAVAVGKAWEAVGVSSGYTAGNNYCGSIGSSSVVDLDGSPALVSPLNCGYTVLPSGNYVELNAFQYVDIYPGFNAANGANYKVVTNDTCIYSNY